METDDKKYEVTLSVRLHGAFTVLAADESCAEEIVNRMCVVGEIKLGERGFADGTRVDCTGESEPNAKAVNEDGGDEDGDEPPKHICPLTQQPCDEECSCGEKANCEYHQGLVDGRAEAKR